jgi:hypothetical protein
MQLLLCGVRLRVLAGLLLYHHFGDIVGSVVLRGGGLLSFALIDQLWLTDRLKIVVGAVV